MKGRLEHIIHRFRKDKVDLFEEVFGEFLQIFFISFRNDKVGDCSPFSCEDFFLESADGEHASS